MRVQLQSIAVGVLVVSSGFAMGEVITGDFPGNSISFASETPSGGFVDELGLYFQGFNEFAGSGVTNYLLTGHAESSGQNFRYLQSGNSGSHFLSVNYFVEGQGMASADSETAELLVMLGSDFGIVDYMGEIGESLYIGFVVHSEPDGAAQINYGFLQIQRGGGLNYFAIGWAYETESGVDLAAFNIPSPSGIALFGVAALGATRRRRS